MRWWRPQTVHVEVKLASISDWKAQFSPWKKSLLLVKSNPEDLSVLTWMIKWSPHPVSLAKVEEGGKKGLSSAGSSSPGVDVIIWSLRWVRWPWLVRLGLVGQSAAPLRSEVRKTPQQCCLCAALPVETGEMPLSSLSLSACLLPALDGWVVTPACWKGVIVTDE